MLFIRKYGMIERKTGDDARKRKRGEAVETEILGVDVYHILSWFIVYSFLGWIWESGYVSVRQRRLVNRGFISGPFVTIYGVGAVLVYLILRPLTGRILELYLGGAALATVLEFLTGVLMEAIFHTSWWDYSDKKWNFQGKICLSSSIAWGFFTLLLFYVFQPAVSRLVDLVQPAVGKLLVSLWLAAYAVDFAFSAAAAFDLRGKIRKLEAAREELQTYFQDYLSNTGLKEAAADFLEKTREYRVESPSSVIRENLAEGREKFRELMEKLGEARDRREGFFRHYDEFAGKYLELRQSLSLGSRRHLKAYPHLISRAGSFRIKERKNKEH